MSLRYKGGIKSAAGASVAAGVGGTGRWTLQEAIQNIAAGNWSGLSTPSFDGFLWGAGGAAGGTGVSNFFCYGGGGAYSTKNITGVTLSNTFTIVVGGGGQLGTQGCVVGTGGAGGTGYSANSTLYGGNGTSAGTSPCSGTGGGGGAGSAILNSSNSILAAAGGGGGGGGTESPENSTGQGGGGGQNGNNGQGSGATGGTAGASGNTNGANGVVVGGDHSGSGGGGGGYAGGNAGLNPTNDALSGGGGGGGSSYGDTVVNGNYQTAGNTASPYYASNYGAGGIQSTAGTSGYVVIRYSDIYPAASSTTGSPTITVAGGYRVYKWTASGSITF